MNNCVSEKLLLKFLVEVVFFISLAFNNNLFNFVRVDVCIKCVEENMQSNLELVLKPLTDEVHAPTFSLNSL